MAIGYHYTNWICWQQIQVQGLRLYPIRHPEVTEVMDLDSVMGIWSWQHPLKGDSHVGSIIYQMAKGHLRVVQLKFTYPAKIELGPPGETILLHHTGTIGELNYHHGETAVILTKPLPPEDIVLIAEYNFGDAWNG